MKLFLLIIFALLIFSEKVEAKDFQIPLMISDGKNEQELNIGIHPEATDGFDEGIDELAPPSPPSGAFDARLYQEGEEYITDIRNTDLTDKYFQVHYEPEDGQSDISVSWEVDDLADDWEFILYNPDEEEVIADMRETDSVNTSDYTEIEKGVKIVIRSAFPVISFNVKDQENKQNLGIGMHPEGSDEFNEKLDQLAPPEPPSGSFDARLSWKGEDYLVDIRDDEKVNRSYHLSYRAADNAEPIKMEWNPESIPKHWNFIITSGAEEDSVKMDMSQKSEFNTDDYPALEEGLKIKARTPLQTIPINVSDGNNEQELEVGLHPEATDNFDEGLNEYAPPAPPSGAFDARLVWQNNEFLTDIRSDEESDKVFEMSYSAAEDAGSIQLNWDTDELKEEYPELLELWKIVLKDPEGEEVSINLQEQDSLNVTEYDELKNGLRIEFLLRSDLVDQAQLYAPGEGDTVSIDPKLRWYSAEGAKRYKIEVSEDDDFENIVFDTETADTLVQVEKLEDDNLYWWRVRSIGKERKAEWSEQKSFSTVLFEPEIVELIEPADDMDAETDTITFRWEASSPMVNSYNIELASDDQFTEVVVDSTVSDTVLVIDDLEPSEFYWWRVRAKNDAGTGPWSDTYRFGAETVSADVDPDEIPNDFALNNNYPNPFNPETQISYELPEGVQVRLAVYNILGEHVTTLVNESQSAGRYEVSFDASNLSSGTYIYRIEAGDFVETRQMMYVK